MAKEDEVLKRYLSDDERYADLINGVSFDGKQVIKAEDLSDRDTQTGYHKNSSEVKGKRKIKYRDLFRKASFGANFMVIGVENQQQVHYLMPVRCMEYDFKEYQRQEVERRRLQEHIKKQSDAEFLSGFSKEGKLHPCITIVLYYGDNWDGSTDLYDLLDFTNIPVELRKMVNNYKINLVDIKKIENTDRFRSDLKQVFEFIRCAGSKEKIKELIANDSAYQSLSTDAYEVMEVFTKSEELMQIRAKSEEEEMNMCQGLKDWAAEEREEGRIGILLCLVKDKILSIENAAERANISLEKFEELYQEYLKQQVA